MVESSGEQWILDICDRGEYAPNIPIRYQQTQKKKAKETSPIGIKPKSNPSLKCSPISLNAGHEGRVSSSPVNPRGTEILPVSPPNQTEPFFLPSTAKLSTAHEAQRVLDRSLIDLPEKC